MGWSCAICTFTNENDTFLACECCGGRRVDTNLSATTRKPTVPSRQTPSSAPKLKLKLKPKLKPKPKPPPSPSLKRPRAPSPPPIARRTSTTTPPTTNPLNALHRLPSNPITVRPPGGGPAITIPDAQLPHEAPASLTRHVLPRNLADRLLTQLHADGGRWYRGTWTVFGRSSPNARTVRTFDTGDTPRGVSEGATAVDAEERGGGDGTGDVFPAGEELREAARIVRDVVRGEGSVAARDWCPTFAFGNRYADGSEHVGFHSDFLLGLGPRPVIAGLSLGATRIFRLRRQGGAGTVVSVPAPHNSLIVMRADCQESWQHSVVKVAGVRNHTNVGTVRYSLTFRMERPEFRAEARVDCDCGRDAALKCKNGSYYLSCNPAGGSASDKCAFYQRSEVAQREATRLQALDAQTHPPMNT